MIHPGTDPAWEDVRVDEHAPQFSVVIPCFNEAECLRTTVTQLADALLADRIHAELVLVDNGSEDGTGLIIDELREQGLPIVKERVDRNQGYGYGILRGFEVARGDFVGLVHADGQVEPHDVIRTYQIAARSHTPRMVKVRRRFRMDGVRRKLISITYNVAANALFGGLGSIDINGNPKVLPRKYLEQMDLQSTDWFIDPEIMIKAKALGLEVFELNAFAQMRMDGVSHVQSSTCWEFVVNLLAYRFGAKGRSRTPAPVQGVYVEKP